MHGPFLLLLLAVAARLCSSQPNPTASVNKLTTMPADAKNDTMCKGVSDKVCKILRQMEKVDLNQLEKYDENSIMVRLIKTVETVYKDVQINVNSLKFLTICQTLQWRSGSAENFFSFSDKIFYYSLTAMTWTEARTWCEWRALELAMLKNSTHLDSMSDELKGRVQSTDTSFWLAATNAGGRGTGKVFSWTDGSKVEASAWASGQPNDMGPGKDMCVAFVANQGKLGDKKCSQRQPILCEVPERMHPCFYTE